MPCEWMQFQNLKRDHVALAAECVRLVERIADLETINNLHCEINGQLRVEIEKEKARRFRVEFDNPYKAPDPLTGAYPHEFQHPRGGGLT